MAGLLDFLNSDDARLGIGLLAAGGPTTDPNQSGLGQRLTAGLQFADASRAQKMREDLMRSQMAENDAQASARQSALARQQQMDAYYLGNNFGAGSTTQAGAMPEGAALKQAVGAPSDAPRPPQGKFAEWSQQFNIPVDALITDYVSNGGKGIADMLYKAGRPDIQVSNGYAYDKNSVKPGYLPQLNVSQDGKSTLVQIGPDGLPVVSAPRGAVGTFGTYQGIQDRSRAQYTAGRPEILPGGRMGGQSVLSEITGGQPGYANEGQMRGNTPLQSDADTAQAARREIASMQRDLSTPGKVADPASRAALQAEIQRLTGQLGANPQASVSGGGVEFSPAEKNQQEAEKTRAVNTAKADVDRDTARQAAQKMQGQIGAAATLAGQLLEQKPTGSGAGALVDRAANFFGQPTKSGDVAQQLEALSGWMVANVPRMEGPQSNADVLNYQTMAGRIGDRSLPVSTRKAALETVMQLQQKYASLNGGEAPAPTQSAAGKLKAPPSQSDLQNTALKYGITVDEVKKRLGM